MVLIVTTCSSRKAAHADQRLRAETLPFGSLAEVSAEWKVRIKESELRLPVNLLYRGRGFNLAVDAAREAGGTLRVISAGLGQVEENQYVPAYGLTVSQGSSDYVLCRIAGSVTAADWWRSIRGDNVSHIDDSHDGLVLVALSSVYLQMVADDLSATACFREERLRIFTRAPAKSIDQRLERFVLPYDDRLDGPESSIPGTKADFAQRALHHFATAVLPASLFGSLEEHRERVSGALASWSLPTRMPGQRKPDGEIRALISKHWASAGGNSARMHRFLRDELAVACEQARFRALFAQVRAERAA